MRRRTITAIAALFTFLMASTAGAERLELSQSNLFSPVDEYIIHHWPDPVNVRTGSILLEYQDIKLPYIQIPLRVTRRYNGASTLVGSFGYGWIANFDMKLSINGQNRIDILEPDGSITIYYRSKDSQHPVAYLSATGFSRITRRSSDKSFFRYFGCNNLNVDVFDERGRLVRAVDRNGNSLTLRYGNDRVTTISDGAGRSLLLSYTGNGLVSSIEDPAKRVFRYHYDGEKNLIKTEAPGVIQTSYSYDQNHNLVAITYPDGSKTAIEYEPGTKRVKAEIGPGEKVTRFAYNIIQQNPLKQTTGVADALGNYTGYRFDQSPSGLTLTITDALGGKTVKVFDMLGNLASVTDANGHMTSFQYDELGRLSGVRNAAGNRASAVLEAECGGQERASLLGPEGGRYTFVKDPVKRMAEITDPVGRETREEYDSRGLLTAIIGPGGNRTEFRHDRYGNRTSLISPSGIKADIDYDVLGRLTSIGDAKGRIYKYKYDDTGHSFSLRGPQGHTEGLSFDNSGRLTKIIDPAGSARQFVYDESGSIAKIVNEEGHEIRISYDAAGNAVMFEDARGNKTKLSYDKLNRVIKKIDPAGREFVYSRDPVGNIVSATGPGGRSYHYKYDEVDRIVEVTSPSGAHIEFQYDAMGNLVSVKQPDGAVTKYRRDPVYRLIECILPSGRSWKFEYNLQGALSRVTDPGGQVEDLRRAPSGTLTAEMDAQGNGYRYAYDGLGLLAETRDTQGNARSYKYDDLNRTVEITDVDSTGGTRPKLEFHYDLLDRIIRVQRGEDFLNYLRDPLGRVISEENSITGLNIGYRYDKNGNLTQIFLNGQQGFSFTYDQLDRLTSITNASGEQFQFAYDTATGNRSRLIYPNGVTAGYNYDADGNVSEISYRSPSQEDLLTLRYQYDAMGNVIKMTEGAESTSYTYDIESMLVRVSAQDGRDTGFKYDKTSNLVSRTRGGNQSETFLVNEKNQLITWGQTTFAYDKGGRMVQMVTSAGKKQFAHDIYGNLERVTLPDSKIIELVYDPLGKRVIKKDSQGAHFYGLVDVDLTWELDEQRQIKATFTHGPGMDEPLAVRRDGKSLFYHADRLGSIRLITDSSGRAVEYLKFGPFGVIETAGRGTARPYRFAGGVLDEDAGLYYFRNRYYMPEIGRFIEKDPLKFPSGDSNPYAYASNNPINRRDPLGLESGPTAEIKIQGTVPGAQIEAGVGGVDPFTVKAGVKVRVGTDFTAPGAKVIMGIQPGGGPMQGTDAQISFKDGPINNVGVSAGGVPSIAGSIGPISVKVQPTTGKVEVGMGVSLPIPALEQKNAPPLFTGAPALGGSGSPVPVPPLAPFDPPAKAPSSPTGNVTVWQAGVTLTGETEVGPDGQRVFKGDNFPEKAGNFLTGILNVGRQVQQVERNCPVK